MPTRGAWGDDEREGEARLPGYQLEQWEGSGISTQDGEEWGGWRVHGGYFQLCAREVSGSREGAVARLLLALPWFHPICDFRNARLAGGAGGLLHDFLHR